jgi:hypothetical protein
MSYQNLPNAQYDGFETVRTHVHCNGLAMMPTAAPFPAAAVAVALHGGMDFEVIGWYATRRGAPPYVPDPTMLATNNPNRIFLGGGRSGSFPISDMSGVEVYALQGWFLFGILAPEGLTSDFMLGNLPFPGLQTGEYVPGTYFRANLINTTQTQTSEGLAVPTQPTQLRMASQQG